MYVHESEALLGLRKPRSMAAAAPGLVRTERSAPLGSYPPRIRSGAAGRSRLGRRLLNSVVVALTQSPLQVSAIQVGQLHILYFCWRVLTLSVRSVLAQISMIQKFAGSIEFSGMID
jgi:hypothetical protein